MPVLNYIYIATVLIAFLSSLSVFRLDLPLHFKIFSSLLGLTFLVEFGSAVFIYGFHHRRNHWIYNAFTLPEFLVYGYFYYQLIRVSSLRRIIFLFLLIFPIFWAISVFGYSGFNNWNSYVLIAGSFFSVVFVLMYYYQAITATETKPFRLSPEFWIATGMLVFYIGALPYLGCLNFLMKYNMGLTTRLLTVYKILDALMYIIFSFGFLWQMTASRKSSS